VQDVIDELRRYVTGWLNDFGISHTYNQVVALAEWVRRRVRLYSWSRPQGDRPQYACGNERSDVATSGNGRGRADAICLPSGLTRRRYTWPRAAAAEA
jgi:hypothetical protein